MPNVKPKTVTLKDNKIMKELYDMFKEVVGDCNTSVEEWNDIGMFVDLTITRFSKQHDPYYTIPVWMILLLFKLGFEAARTADPNYLYQFLNVGSVEIDEIYAAMDRVYYFETVEE